MAARTGVSRTIAVSAAAIVVLGVALRVAGMRQGLPDFGEEAVPFRWALAMWAHVNGRIDWNPHHFIYPSLTIYLQLGLQLLQATLGHIAGHYAGAADYHLAFQIDPTPMVLLARSLGIAADAVSLVLVCRLGERMRPGAGLVAALLMACSPIMISTSRAIYSDPIMLALVVAALARMQDYRAEGGLRPLLLVSALTGLAMGAKYPAVVLLLPLAWTLTRAHGRAVARAGALALLVVAITFLATSPYVLLDHPTFLRDVRFDRVLATEGLLGATGRASGWSTLAALGRDLGPVAVLLALAGLALMVWRDRRRPGAVAVTLAGAAFLLPIVISPLRFERYLLGAIPAVALLAGLAVSFAVSRVGPRARVATAAMLALALALPALAGAFAVAAEPPHSTQRQALDWCEAHLDHAALILMESYGPPLLTRQNASASAASELLPRASAAMRERFLARKWFSAVRIPALVAGTCDVELRPRGRAPVTVTVFAHAADFNSVVYDPRLLTGVDYVITSSAIRARFTAEPMRYAVPCAFYRLLDSATTVAARFESLPGTSGPSIVIYRLAGTGFHAPALVDRWWWTEHIPLDYRTRANDLLAPGANLGTGPVSVSGEPAPWVSGLREFYGSQVAYFARDLSYNLIELDRGEPAQRLLDAALAIDPASQWTCLLLVEASRMLDDWPAARAAFERTAAVSGSRVFDAALVAEYAEALARTGAPTRAAALRDSLARATRH